MEYRTHYENWLLSPSLSNEERGELSGLTDEKEIESRFFSPLTFGTAGLRGIMGTGLNRLNRHTVSQATQGLAAVIVACGPEAARRGVAIAYDCRTHSDEFARNAACVLAANGINVLLFDDMRPTPELSFVIRHENCIAGINITASHNPKEYNGYKAYWEDGAQLDDDMAARVQSAIAAADIFTGVRTIPFYEAVSLGRIRIIGEQTDEAFLDAVLSSSINPEYFLDAADDFKLVYTPFHGAGRKLIPEAFSRLGLKNVLCVAEQMIPDGSFPTVKSPNPEEKAGFALAVDLARKNNVDLIIGTDPDGDRVGIMLRSRSGDYSTLSGNQIGALLVDYIIRARREKGTLPPKPAIVKSIVTTFMADKIAAQNDVACYDSFTGFRFIAEKIREIEETEGRSNIFAFEESYGYLTGDYVRDKDAVTASVLIAEMALHYHKTGMTLYDAMDALYKKYGFFSEYTLSLVMPGLDGLQKMKALMSALRSDPPACISDTAVSALRDYQDGTRRLLQGGPALKLGLSGSNVLYFELADGTAFIVRPSGTEPKIKIYILASGETSEDCALKIRKYSDCASAFVGQ